MRDGFEISEQRDFSAGEFRSVAPHLIPRNGAFSIRNGLLDEDGSVYRRGGSVYKSTSGLGSAGLTFLWTGFLGGTVKTLIANATDFASMDPAGVLTNLGGAGLALPVPAVEFGGLLHIGGGVTWDGAVLGTAAHTAAVYAVAGHKLIALDGNRAYQSDPDDPTVFGATNFQEVPESAQTIAGAGLGDRLLWFTAKGAYLLSDVELDLTNDLGDPQQRLEHAYPELIAWASTGLAYWAGGVIVPCLDGLWLVDGVSRPRLLSRSVQDLWREYVNAGYRPGVAAVHRGHYFLPVLSSGGSFVKLLVCRLQPVMVDGLGEVWPWTHLEESGAEVSAVVEDEDGALLGTEMGDTSRVVRLPYFDPSSTVKADASGAAHSFRVTTRDDVVASMSRATVVAVEASYELEDAGSDDPFLLASYATGARQAETVLWGATTWGGATWASGGDDTMTLFDGQAPEDALGSDPYVWREPVRCRRIRVRLESTQPAAKLVLRGVRKFIRPSGRQI